MLDIRLKFQDRNYLDIIFDNETEPIEEVAFSFFEFGREISKRKECDKTNDKKVKISK